MAPLTLSSLVHYAQTLCPGTVMTDNHRTAFGESTTVHPKDEPPHPAAETPCLTLVYHPDLRRVGERLRLFAEGSASVAVSRSEPHYHQPAQQEARTLDTSCVSRSPFWLAPAAAGAVRLSPEECGTELFADGRTVHGPTRFSAQELDRGVVLEVGKRVVLLLHRVGATPRCERRLGFVGESEPMEQLRELLLRVAPSSASVLLQGESGTGKELAAQALHDASPRRDRPFLCVNMAAVPTATAAAELFGHVAGAFTGATRDRLGYFGRADGGSLFLDEVGATTPEVQAMLLRVLDSGEVQPVGASTQRTVDVRVLAATDEDLDEATVTGRFRAPLFHRLSASQVTLCPLRDRRDDIGRLLVHFLSEELAPGEPSDKLVCSTARDTPWLPARLVARLVEYTWPGNVRQLQNVVRQMVITHGDAFSVDTDAVLARLDVGAAKSAEQDLPTVEPAPSLRPSEISEEELVATMRANQYNIRATAEQLGISRNSLYGLISRSQHLRKARDIGREELQACLLRHGDDWGAMAEHLGVSVKALKLRKKELGLA